MSGTIFSACEIKETHFINAKLAKTSFSDSSLEGSVFHNTDLAGADFQGAERYSINPSTNNVKKAHFSSPEALSLLKELDIIIS